MKMNEFLQTQCKEVTKNIESLFETLSAVLDATHETYSTCDIRINERGDFAVVDADNKIVGSVSRDFNEMKIICAKFTDGDVVATCSRYAGDSKPAVEEFIFNLDPDRQSPAPVFAPIPRKSRLSHQFRINDSGKHGGKYSDS